jgi:hypothetical protein
VRVRQEILAAFLSAVLLSGCAPQGPIPPKLDTTAAVASRADDESDTLDIELDDESDKRERHRTKELDEGGSLDPSLEYRNAVRACTRYATNQTVGSVLAILSRLRPGAYTAKYVDCMRTKGYAVDR